ncbi:MAG TPA: oxalate/formate MFS antiporter [Anaeromyxobacteraceae bacterium]|nr:oxalate/formate MFS antiporter [Anaeromyxobacteraceae bacterium]
MATDSAVPAGDLDIARKEYGPLVGNRWVQLVAGIVGMIVISNYQYAFTLFTPGMKAQFAGEPYAKIAAVFSAFILFETWPAPVAGYFVDRLGIRKLMSVGAAMIGLGWLLGGLFARSVLDLYLYYGVVAGTGAGVIYIACVSNAVKWFPDRRGLAAGLTAAGFGGGAALTVMPIASTIGAFGWAKTMAGWGVGQGLIAMGAAMILRHPPAGWAPRGWAGAKPGAAKGIVQSKTSFTWSQVLRRPEFYLLYAMFVFAMLGGMTITANLSQIARTLNVSSIVFFGIGIVPLTVTLTSLCNALARILWGRVSDKLGRENTMALVFSLQAVVVALVTWLGSNPYAFVILFALVFLFWGSVFSLFAAITGDIFGAKNAAVNYGLLYTGKGVGSILAGYGAALMAALFAGSFTVPFHLSAILAMVAAMLAFFALKPLVRWRIAHEGAPAVPVAEPAPRTA